MADKTLKKGPGRPKKMPPGPPIPMRGIISAPSDPAFVVQLVYYNPTMFKNIFAYFKRAEASEVYMSFTATGVLIYARDHEEESNSIIEIFGAAMNEYYCREPVDICVGYKNMNTALKNASKSCAQISIVLNESDRRSTLYLSIDDRESGVQNSYEIATINPGNNFAVTDIPFDYPLEFKLTAKCLRDTVKQAKSSNAKTVSIHKSGTSPLQIVASGGINSLCSLNDNFVTKNRLGADDILVASIKVNVIRAFAEATLGKDLEISVDSQHQARIFMVLDTTAVVEGEGDGAVVRHITSCNMKVFFKLDM